MTTPQILKSIARKLGLNFRVPSSESQKLEAINKALPRFTTDPPFITSFVYTQDSDDTVVLTYSEPVELLAGTTPDRWTLTVIENDGTTEALVTSEAVQTGASEITLTFSAATGATNYAFLHLDIFVPAVVSVATFTPERVGSGFTVWAGAV